MSKIALKRYNNDTAQWETQTIENPELTAHAGAKASLYQAGHVQLTSALDSESEVLVPTAKALKTVFEAVSAHANEEGSHLTPEQLELINAIPNIQTTLSNILERLETLGTPTA